MSEPTGPATALRSEVNTHDGPRGERLRGGRVLSIQDGEALLEVLCEPNTMVRRFRGPAEGLEAGQPIVCWLKRGPGYQLVKVQPSYWASASDAQRARDG